MPLRAAEHWEQGVAESFGLLVLAVRAWLSGSAARSHCRAPTTGGEAGCHAIGPVYSHGAALDGGHEACELGDESRSGALSLRRMRGERCSNETDELIRLINQEVTTHTKDRYTSGGE